MRAEISWNENIILQKKWSFPSNFSLVNVNKSANDFLFVHICLKILTKTFFLWFESRETIRVIYFTYHCPPNFDIFVVTLFPNN